MLTVGVRFSAKTESFAEYVDNLVAAKVAALGFGEGLEFDEVPQQLLDAAAKRGLPVLKIPRQTAFLSVTQAVATERVNRAQRRHDALARVQAEAEELLLRSPRDGKPEGALRTVLDLICARLEVSAAIARADGSVVTTTDPAGSQQACNAVAESAPKAAPGTGAAVTDQLHIHPRAWSMSIGENRIFVFAEPLRRASGGAELQLIVAATRPLKADKRAVVKNIAAVASIFLMATVPSAATGQLALSCVVADPGRIGKARRRLMDWAGEKKVWLIAAEAERSEQVHDLAPGAIWIRVDKEASSWWLGLSRNPPQRPARPVVAACSGPVDVAECSAELVEKLICAARTVGPGEEFPAPGGVLGWALNPEIARATRLRLAEVTALFEGADPEIFRAVRAYVATGGSMTGAAGLLGVHRHTLRHRLDQAARRGLDLNDPARQAELFVLLATHGQLDYRLR